MKKKRLHLLRKWRNQTPLNKTLPKLVVDLLVKDEHLPVHVVDPDVVRLPGVVLDEARHAAAALVPAGVRGRLGLVDLDHGRGEGLATGA